MSKIIYPDDNEIQEQIQEIINKSGIFEDVTDDTIREIHSVDNRKNKRIHMMREFATIAAAAIIVIMGSVVVASIAGKNTEALKNNYNTAQNEDNMGTGSSVASKPYTVEMITSVKNYTTSNTLNMSGALDITYPVLYAPNGSIVKGVDSYYNTVWTQHNIGNNKMTVSQAEYSAVESAGFKIKGTDNYVVSFYNMYDYVIGSFLGYNNCTASVSEVTGATFSTNDKQMSLSDIFAANIDYYNAITYITSKENAQQTGSGYDTKGNIDVSVQDTEHSAYVCFNMSYSDIKDEVYAGNYSDTLSRGKEGSLNWYLTNDGIVLTASIPEAFDVLASGVDEKDFKALMSTYGIDTNNVLTYTFEVSSVKITFDELKEAGIALAIETE